MADKEKRNLTPGQKKLMMYAGIAAAVILGANYISKSNEESRTARPVEHVLTDRDPKHLGMESLIAQIKIANDKLTAQEAQNRKLQKDFEVLRKDQMDSRSQRLDSTRFQQQLQALADANDRERKAINDQITKLTQENDRLNKIINSAPKIDLDGDGIAETPDLSGVQGGENTQGSNYAREGNGRANRESGSSQSRNRQGSGATTERIRGADPIQRNRGGSSAGTQRQRRDQGANTGLQRPQRGGRIIDNSVNIDDPYALYEEMAQYGQSGIPTMDAGETSMDGFTPTSKIKTIVEYKDPAKEAEKLQKKRKTLYIPVGSMLRGVLLTGLYAPTGQNSRKDPYPVILRVQDEMIMPNLKRADLRECFVMLSGYGDMSSERAMLRGEALSCIANDNSVLEASLASYAVGEDGKAGVRGKLISRNGKALRNVLLSGFASGVSEAFETSAVPQLDISGSSSTTYTSAISSKTVNNGLFKGASAALSKLADYYMKMADQTMPVIEIAAGREVTVAVTAGVELSVKRDGNGDAPSNRQSSSSSGSTGAQPRQNTTPQAMERAQRQNLNQNIQTAAAATAARAR